MAQRKTLTEAQVELLRWVGQGCPDGVYDGVHHRISAASLARRGLITVEGRGPTWSASVVEVGKDYLAQVDGPTPPVPRQPNETGVVAQMISEVIAAGGTLVVPSDGVNWERRVRQAIRRDKVPEGKRLEYKSDRRARTAEIRLVDAPEGTTLVLSPVPVPDRVARYHRVVQAVRNDKSRIEISDAALSRASRILQGLVVEAELRGFTVAIPDGHQNRHTFKLEWSSSVDGHLVITTAGHSQALRIHERGLRVKTAYERPDPWDRNDPLDLRRAGTYRQVRDDTGATGQLRIDLVPDTYGARASSWSDLKRSRLEDKLPAVLAEISVRAAEAEHARIEAERQAAARQVAWEAAMVEAEERLHQARCAAELDDQLTRWEQATRIRAYCDHLQTTHPDASGTMEWVTWARSRADALDPTMAPPSSPKRLAEVRPEDLRPYLDGLSPYGPEARH